MKKLLLLVFILCSLMCNAKGKKSFFYDGIELQNVRGWNIIPSKDDNSTTITGFTKKETLQFRIVKQGVPKNFKAEAYLQNTVEKIMEANMATSFDTPKIKEVSDIAEGFVNDIPAKYIDVTYTKKNAQRIYVFTMHNKLFTITCTGVGVRDASLVALFTDFILRGFSYNPEVNPYGLL